MEMENNTDQFAVNVNAFSHIALVPFIVRADNPSIDIQSKN